MFILWLAGVLIIAVLIIQRLFFVKGLIAQSEPAGNRLVGVLDKCREKVGVHRNIKLKLSHNVTSPAVCGLFRPVILIPKTLLEKLSQNKLEAVLTHEMAHVKRGDLWINSLQTFLQIVYFYNPFVWLANSTVRRIREQAVDEMVLVALGTQADSYSNTLIDIAEMAFSRPALSLRLVGVVESKKALSRRIKHILSRPLPKNTKLGIAGLLAIIVSAAVLLPMAKANREPSVPEKEQVSKKFMAKLPNGVTVELVGLFTGQSKEELTWWRPDGNLMSEKEYKEYTFYEGRIIPLLIRHHETWKFEYGYVLRFTPSDVSMMVDVTAGTQGPYGHPDVNGISINIVESYNTQREKGMPQIGDINVAAAYGPFTVRGWNRGSMNLNRVGLFTQSFTLDDGSTILLSPVRPDQYEPDRGLMVDATVNANDVDINILYESKDGKKHKAQSSSRSGSTLVSPIKEPKAMSQRTFRLESVKQEELKRIAVEYRRFKRISFKAVALKPNVKTNVQVAVEGIYNQLDKQSSQATIVLLPDVDNKPLMLDLASGELVDVPKADTEQQIGQAIEKLGKGDLIFDASSLILVRGTTTQRLPGDTAEPFKKYKIGQNLPEILNVETKEGIEYVIEIRSIDETGCLLNYHRLYPNHYISAVPLNDLEHSFVERLLELVRQVEEKYPDKATHWPEGPGLYHIDAQGNVTIWRYQKLWHRSNNDCAEDEVGSGSSQLVKATGMYYLPDGTPLQSRWSYRDQTGGMKDIRVDIGRAVGESERVGLIHRHILPSDCDLLSRDGLERKIVLRSYEKLPLAITVRIDRPTLLGSWQVGDNETDILHFDEYDQLTVTGPPERSSTPMLITVRSMKRTAVDQQPDVQIETTDYSENSTFQSDQNEKVIGIIKEVSDNIGEITAEHGDAVYGNNIRYTPSLYLGRVRNGTKVQLINPNVIEDQYRIPIIKIKTISACPGLPTGTIGWIKLKNSSFKDQFVAHENVQLLPHSSAIDTNEQNKAKIILRANVFSINAPISLITDYLRDELGVENTTSEMTDSQAGQFRKWMGTIPETTMISSPSILVFDGEKASMSVISNQKEYTTDYEKTSDSPPHYKPVQQKFTTGIELEFTPALTKDNSVIHLSMKFDKTDLVKVEEKKDESGNTIQLPTLTNSEIMTQVAVPVGKYFLVSAAGLYPAKNDSQPEQPAKQIILLVKADVQENADSSNKRVPAGMVGTWFFDNPMGDEEQMAIFPDGRVVVLYSNGHKDHSLYENGFIELAEYDNARFKINILENGTLIQYFDTETGGLAKRWRRIDSKPHTELLRALTGQDNSQSDVKAKVISSKDKKLLGQMATITEAMVQAFNDGDLETLLSYYTDDGIRLPDQAKAAIGKDALRELQIRELSENAKIQSFKELDKKTFICGDYVFETGKVVISFSKENTRFLLSDWLNYVTIWNRQPDGSLKIKLDATSPAVIPEGGNIPDTDDFVILEVISDSKPTDDMKAVYEQIKKYENEFHQKFIERDVWPAAQFYAEQALLMPRGQDASKGRREILEAIWKGMNEIKLEDMTVDVVHIEGNNKIIYAANIFTWTFKDPSSGQDVTFPGKGVHVWSRQEDGSWKILLDLNNVSVPIPGN